MTSRMRAALGANFGHVIVDGVHLAYDDGDAGDTVVCLHAIGHGAGDFARLRARLRGRFRVLALDWPGHGNSGDDHVPPRASRYADLLAGVLDALDVRRAAIVGNSIGGAAAIRFAASHPDRVRGLVLENPGGLDRSAPTAALSRTVIGLHVALFSRGAAGARWYGRAFGAYYRTVLQRRAAAAQRARIVASAYEIAPVLRDAWRGFAEPAADLRDLPPRVTCPVLFAWAARDQVIQLRRNLPTIRRFPDARVERFSAGHAPHLETPEAFEASVESFLARLRE